jgi:hypothetical protein
MNYPYEYEKAYQEAVDMLKLLKKDLGSYQAVADVFDLNKNYIYRILKQGYKPTRGKLMQALGLPSIELIPMAVCPECSQAQFGNECGCTGAKPKIKKPLREDYRKRIRIDINPTTDAKTVKAIRAMPIDIRTDVLKFIAAMRSVPKCPKSPTGECLFSSDGSCIHCGRYEEDMDHRSNEEKND